MVPLQLHHRGALLSQIIGAQCLGKTDLTQDFLGFAAGACVQRNNLPIAMVGGGRRGR